MVGQALAQQCPATLPVVMPNLVVLFNGSYWTSYNNAVCHSMMYFAVYSPMEHLLSPIANILPFDFETAQISFDRVISVLCS